MHRDEQLGVRPTLLRAGALGAHLSELGGAIGKGTGDRNWGGGSSNLLIFGQSACRG